MRVCIFSMAAMMNTEFFFGQFFFFQHFFRVLLIYFHLDEFQRLLFLGFDVIVQRLLQVLQKMFIFFQLYLCVQSVRFFFFIFAFLRGQFLRS